MKNQVKIIAHPETGKLFTETSNPDFVKCQLETREVVVQNGVMNVQKRVAFPLLSTSVVAELGTLKSGDVFPIQGKITRHLTSTPQFEGHKPVVNPKTGEDMGYYQTFEFTTNLAAYDTDERVSTPAPQTTELKPNIQFDTVQ